MSKADHIVALAKAFSGLSAHLAPEQYAYAIGCEGENDQFRRDYVPTKRVTHWNASCCALLARNILRLAGVADPLVHPSYLLRLHGGAIGQLGEVARRAGARRAYTREGALPGRGAIVCLGPASGGKSYHIDIVTGEGEVVAGGQDDTRDGGFGGGTAIRTLDRSFVVLNGALYACAGGVNRPVVWWIDPEAI